MYKAHLITANNITIITSEETLSVPSSHMSFGQVKRALGDGDFDYAIEMADAAVAINDFGEGQVYVQDGVVFYGGHEVHNSVATRIAAMIEEGQSVTPLVNFLENLLSNPSGRAVKELYRFLECNSLPITPDGYFLAYKNVSENFTDRHSGTFDNSLGATCEMARNEVMDDPNQTCSAGLHFCSMEYLNSMWGHSGHTMVVKINPKDVVSIPVDYNNSKGRCCKYEVIAEHMDGKVDTLGDGDAVYEYTQEDVVEAWNAGYDEGTHQDAAF